MATTQKMTSKQYFATQAIIHLALIAGQVLFGAVTIYLRFADSSISTTEELSKSFIYIVPLLAAAGIVASFQIFKLLVKKAKENPTLSKKISTYGSAMIVRYAILEAPSLFGIVAFYLTGEYLFLAIAGLIIILFLIIRPSRGKLIQDLEPNSNEEILINTPDAIIMERNYSNRY